MTDTIKTTPQGSAPATVSILNTAMTGMGYTASEALAAAIELAQLGDRRGFTRYWVSEHHSMPGVTTSTPAVLLARLTAHTERIRLGSGGVMLPNHAPLAIAEQYGMLDALAPGRVDLGLGRAPGTDHPTAAALRREHGGDGDDFPRQVLELLGFLTDTFPPGHPYTQVHAVPGPWQNVMNGVDEVPAGPSVWMLGSSLFSARLAGELGRPYAFAYHLAGDGAAEALAVYRASFRPSAAHSAPYAAVSVGVTVCDDEAEARRQASSVGFSMLSMFRGERFAIPTPDKVAAFRGSAREHAIIDEWTDRAMHGNAQRVSQKLAALQAATGADELMLSPSAHSLEIQLDSIDRLADVWGMPSAAA